VAGDVVESQLLEAGSDVQRPRELSKSWYCRGPHCGSAANLEFLARSRDEDRVLVMWESDDEAHAREHSDDTTRRSGFNS
jgi:hypothetical protein